MISRCIKIENFEHGRLGTPPLNKTARDIYACYTRDTTYRIEDDSDLQTAGWAGSDILAIAQVLETDLEPVTAGARVLIYLEDGIESHVLNFDFIVDICFVGHSGGNRRPLGKQGSEASVQGQIMSPGRSPRPKMFVSLTVATEPLAAKPGSDYHCTGFHTRRRGPGGDNGGLVGGFQPEGH